MKIVRLLTLLITIPILSSITYSTAIARDCSNPKGFHEKMMCKLEGTKLMSGSSTESTTENKSKSSGGSLWKKIKNFGGKNVGEPG